MRTLLAAVISFVGGLFLLACALALYWFVGWTVSAEPGRYGGTVHSNLEGATLLIFQAVFYLILIVFLAAIAGGSFRVARILRGRPQATVVLVLFLIGVVALPFLMAASNTNDCALGTSFPLDVPGCD